MPKRSTFVLASLSLASLGFGTLREKFREV